MSSLDELEKRLNYHFVNRDLLEQALTHPSYGSDKPQYKTRQGRLTRPHYERLEFLGDTVLSLVISEYLLKNYPDENEGSLAKRRAALVCGDSLAAVAQHMDLGDFLYMTNSEIESGGRSRRTNLENSFEALIAALYLDGGLEIVREFIINNFAPLALEMETPPKDSKTALQEWAQARGKNLPQYELVDSTGPSHAPLFTVQVHIEGIEDSLSGTGRSKRLAERKAAEEMMHYVLLQENSEGQANES
jgi:ribonuclease-3